MTRHKRSWTAAEVATALAMVQACGGIVEAASRECGVPARTLYRWIADQPARSVRLRNVGLLGRGWWKRHCLVHGHFWMTSSSEWPTGVLVRSHPRRCEA